MMSEETSTNLDAVASLRGSGVAEESEGGVKELHGRAELSTGRQREEKR